MINPNTPKTKVDLTMGESIRQIWVKCKCQNDVNIFGFEMLKLFSEIHIKLMVYKKRTVF